MSVHIRYRFLKEKGEYLKDPEMTRGYTMVEANRVHPYYEVLKHFYNDFKGRGVQIFNIWRTPNGQDDYRIEEEGRRNSV